MQRILKLTRWLIEEIGFDGFRYDFVKGYGANTITAIQEYRYMRDGKPFIPYGVAEFWDSASNTLNWVNEANFSNSNPVDAFDFPLRELLKSLCDQYGFSLKNLVQGESILQKQNYSAVTFVENHDLRDEGRPITNDKLLAYSYILTHEGYPCVFWKDYYNLQSCARRHTQRHRRARQPRMKNMPQDQPAYCISMTISTSCSAVDTEISLG